MVLLQHLAVQCTPENRTKVIAETLQVYSGTHGRAIVFCAMKREADKFATSNDLRIETHVLHGDIPQDKREMVLKVKLFTFSVLSDNNIYIR